jgi:TolB protein
LKRLAATSALIALFSLSASAQVTIDITKGGLRTPIAVPDMGAEPGLVSIGMELAETIRYDLEFTGLFNLVPKSSYPPGFVGFPADATQLDLEPWQDTGAEFVLYAYMRRAGETLIVEGRLFEVLTGTPMFSKEFSAPERWRRALAHRFADEIVEALTGNRGIATSQIAFTGVTQPGGDTVKEIYIMDYDGHEEKAVTQHGSISILPRMSPDGNSIAYLSYKDRYPFLYVLSLRTGKSRPLSKEVGMNVSPAWSPDGGRIAMALSRDANAEIYLINADGSGRERLTNDRALDTSPCFSPDGSRIAFVSDRQGNPQIFVMSVNGGAADRLSFQGGSSYSPAWSPDGRMIAYVAEKPGDGLEIYVMDADGGNARRLTQSSGSNESPSWSADSRHVVFASTRTGRSELWSVTVETGKQQRIPNVSVPAQGPSWGPRRGE